MAAYVEGVWSGTRASDTFPAYNAYGGAFGGPKEIRALGNGTPGEVQEVKVTFTSQGEYRKLAPGDSVSAVSGQLSFGSATDAFIGFVSDSGLIKLIFYDGGSFSDTTFIGSLSQRGPMHQISGHLMGRMAAGPNSEPWAWAWINYHFGTLTVTKFAVNLSDRAFLRNFLRRVF